MSKSIRIILGMIILSILLLVASPPRALTVIEAASSTSCGTNCSQYDVVVIGSEIQGVLLAREIRNAGLQVMILDPRSKPGGELIQGQMFYLDQPNDKKGKSLVQGEFKKLFDGYNNGSIRKAADFNRYYQSLIKDIPIRNGITILSVNTSLVNKEQTVQSIAYKTKDGVKHIVKSKYFVENSDFNALTAKLNEKRIAGMESLSKNKKPEYMAATLMIKFKNVDWKKLHQAVLQDYPLTNVQKKYGPNTYVDWNIATGFGLILEKYKPRDKQLLLRGMNTVDQKNGEAIMNGLLVFDVNPSDPESVKSAIKKGAAEAPYVLSYMQKNIPGFAKAQLNGTPDYLYIRDYNRFETEYILDYEDLKKGTMFWDNVSIGGYAMDLQATRSIPKGIGFGRTDRYGLPLRSFELKSYENVLVVGKNIGASIKAYGSARIMANNALAAQSIGIILGRELKSGKRLKDLTQQDFKRIHLYLKKDYKIVLNS